MFVLDRSGSMSRRKIEQLKNAMAVILKDMKPEDRLNILFFDDKFDWLADNTMLEGTVVNFDKARRFVKAITTRGGKLRKTINSEKDENKLAPDFFILFQMSIVTQLFFNSCQSP